MNLMTQRNTPAFLPFLFLFILLAPAIVTPVQAQNRLKVMHYNLLGFGDCDGVSVSDKYQWLGTILEHYQPHLFTVNELTPQQAYINGIKALSFDYTSDIEAFPYTNQANSNIVNTLFYDKSLFQPVKAQPDVIAYSLRDINAYSLIYLPSISGGATDTLFVRCIVSHFKAGQGSSEESSRAGAANLIMNYLRNVPDEEYVLVMGDFNVYSHQEAAFQAMINATPATESLVDVTGAGITGWNGPGNAHLHTQSTRTSSPDCGSGGGMDDRFDIILASQSLIDGNSDIRIDSSSYKALGNNGQYYNQELGCSGNSTIPFSVCLAIKQMSDHLPVVVELEVDGSVSVMPPSRQLSVQVIPGAEEGLFRAVLPYPDNWKVEVGSLDGRVLATYQTHQNEMDLNLRAYPQGIYWIRISDSDSASGWQKIIRRGATR